MLHPPGPRRLINPHSATVMAVIVTVALTVAGCSTSSAKASRSDSQSTVPQAADSSALVIYNAQHEDLTQAWADAFTAESGIKVQMRNGDDLSMANQIVAEGSASPADVFITENSPGMSVVEKAGLFADVVPSTLAQVPKQFTPSTGKWVGVAARSTVFVYNTTKIKPADLPKSIMDLADPKWKSRWGASPGGADFQAIVSAMLQLKGASATKAWLMAMKTNAAAYKSNSTVLKAVNAGEIAGGVIYHYYWYGDQAKTKENSKNTQLEYFGHQDPGAFVSVSGAGVLTSSTKQAQAQKFLAFITSKAGQNIVANIGFEYPVNGATTAANKSLKPLDTLDPPVIDPSSLNSKQVVDLMTQAGLL